MVFQKQTICIITFLILRCFETSADASTSKYIPYSHHHNMQFVNIFTLFEGHFFDFKEFFSENSVLMYGLYSRAASNQERLMMVRVRYILAVAICLPTGTPSELRSKFSYRFLFLTEKLRRGWFLKFSSRKSTWHQNYSRWLQQHFDSTIFLSQLS